MKRLTFLLVPLCLAAAGCAGSALHPDDAQQQEIQALKTRIVELQREAAMSQVELAQLRQQVAELETRNGGATRPAAPSLRPARARAPMAWPKSAAVEPPKTAPRPAAPAPVMPTPAAPATAAPAPV